MKKDDKVKMEKLRILNAYCGIGGNRKLWDSVRDDIEITAIEIDPKIAKIYQNFFPKDKVIVADAHQYLLDHFKEFDFIWSSPPCPSHSRIRFGLGVGSGQVKGIYPDMKLYEEILLLQGYFKGKYCVENVISWYRPLIMPQEINKHYFWANFYIHSIGKKSRNHTANLKKLQNRKGFNLDKYRGINKEKVLRNCVEPETGLHIFQEAFREHQQLF